MQGVSMKTPCIFRQDPPPKNPLQTKPANPEGATVDRNYQAFLDMLAYSEGTDKPEVQKSNCRGYDVIVGGSLFNDFSDHPRKLVFLPKLNIRSSAAGRYQILRGIWDTLQKRLKLKDFTARSQDLACLELLRECGALAALNRGEFDEAVASARKIWASLPGAGYGQREESLATLRKIYMDRGGRIA